MCAIVRATYRRPFRWGVLLWRHMSRWLPHLDVTVVAACRLAYRILFATRRSGRGLEGGNACRTGVCHTVPCLGMNIARACLLCSALGLLGACAVHSTPPSHHQNTQNSSSLHNHKLQPNMQPMLYMERFSFAVSVGFRSGELGGASMQSSVLCPRSLLPPPTNPAAPQSVAPQKVLFDAPQSPLASTSTPGSFAGPGRDRLSSLRE